MGQRYLTLDGMRGVAAIAVVVFHVGEGVRVKLLPLAWLSVDFFFLLSGFVLAAAYERQLANRTLLPANFMRLRLIRLWPLLALGTALGGSYAVLRALSFQDVAGAAWMAAATTAGAMFLPLPFASQDGWLYPVNIPAWSLLFELLANAAFCLLAPYLTTRRLAAMVAIGAFAVVGARILAPHDAAHLGGFGAGLARVWFSFFFGVLLYRFRPQTRPSDILPLAAVVALGAVLVFGAPGIAFELAAVLLIFPALVMAGAAAEPRASMASACGVLGAASYAVYVLHEGLKQWALFALNRLAPGLPTPIVALLVVTLAFGAALLADRYWDAPIRRALAGRPTYRPREAV